MNNTITLEKADKCKFICTLSAEKQATICSALRSVFGYIPNDALQSRAADLEDTIVINWR